MSGSSAGASLEPVRRFEVFTGEGRRRKWALADKIALVAEMAATDNISELAPSWHEAIATVHLAPHFLGPRPTGFDPKQA